MRNILIILITLLLYISNINCKIDQHAELKILSKTNQTNLYYNNIGIFKFNNIEGSVFGFNIFGFICFSENEKYTHPGNCTEDTLAEKNIVNY